MLFTGLILSDVFYQILRFESMMFKTAAIITQQPSALTN